MFASLKSSGFGEEIIVMFVFAGNGGSAHRMVLSTHLGDRKYLHQSSVLCSLVAQDSPSTPPVTCQSLKSFQ